MIRKFLSIVWVFSIILWISPVQSLLAAGSLTVTDFYLNSEVWTVYMNPGDMFEIMFYWTNNWAETITSLKGNVYFNDNNSFEYVNAYVYENISGAWNVYLPTSAYTSADWLTATFSWKSWTALPWESPRIRTYPWYAGHKVKNTISTYDNYMYWKFTGLDESLNPVSTPVSSIEIKVNVKPHITSKYFELTSDNSVTTSVQSSFAQEVNFVMEVKDYNWCTNIDGGTITADLSDLGLTPSESLVYSSCKPDGKTAIFKRTGITTNEQTWFISIPSTSFSATDEDGNLNDEGDTNFVEASETNPATITITSADAPIVTISNVSETLIWGPDKQTSTISYSSTQPWDLWIYLDSCGGTILSPQTTYTANTPLTYDVNASDLSEGTNYVYVCNLNSGWNEGSASTSIELDTTAPIFSDLTNTWAVIWEDANAKFSCNESWEYKIDVINSLSTTTEVTAWTWYTNDTLISTTIPNSTLSDWNNTVRIYCKDGATNVWSYDLTILKEPEAPDMTWVVTLSDNDSDLSGLDWRDITITWDNTTGLASPYFVAYRLYILPSWTTLDIDTHSDIKVIVDANTNSFTWTETLTTDSAWNALVWGADYVAFVAINGQSWDTWAAVSSTATTLVSDIVANAVVTKAEFTSDTELKVTFDTDIDTNTGSHDLSKITYSTTSGTQSPTAITNVSGKVVTFTIPTLNWNTAEVWTSLTIEADWIRSSIWGYNFLDNYAWNIEDKQAPVVSNLMSSTSPAYSNFYNNNLDISYDLSEDILDWWNSYVEFKRSSWNSDAVTHIATIISSENLSWSNTKSMLLWDNSSSLNVDLRCWTTYNVRIFAKDQNGLSSFSTPLTNIAFDDCAPSLPILTEIETVGSTTVDFAWSASSDDLGNGSGVKDYTVNIYSDTACSALHSTINVGTNSHSTTLTDWDFSWEVIANDNAGNSSNKTACDEFAIDSTIPSISNMAITDTTISSINYMWDGNTVEVTATIPNASIDSIWANLSGITWDAGHNDVNCNAPVWGITCTYAANTVTFTATVNSSASLTEGTKTISIRAQNASFLNEQTKSKTIKADLAAPTVGTDTITYPNSGETLGWTSVTVTWDSTKITDTIDLKEVKVFYLKGGVEQAEIYSGPNSGSVEWDLTGLVSGIDYGLRIKAYDFVWNEASDDTDTDFTLDKDAPTVPSNTVITPNGTEIHKAGDILEITWDNAGISDDSALATNPIKLEYTLDWTNYNLIAEDEANDWTYNWTIPNNSSNSVTIRLTAKDNAWNESSDTSDATFIIDTVSPTLSITYAWSGWNTPQNGRSLNNSGFTVTWTTSDTNLDSVAYIFENTTDWTFFDWTSYVWSSTEVNICTDWTVLWTDASCNNISSNINPTIEHGKNYALKIVSTDEAWNKSTTAAVSYTWDLNAPNIAISTWDNSYVWSSVTISWTSSDVDSGISSVSLQITNNSGDYFDGTSFVSGMQTLSVSTSDNYGNWSYNFNAPADADNTNYTVKAIASDSAYRDNNTAETQITIIKDATAPSVTTNEDFFTSIAGGELLSGWDSLTITWSPVDINEPVSGLKDNSMKLEYYNWTDFTLIADSLDYNAGTYSWTVPSIDITNTRVRATFEDNVWNTSTQNSYNFNVDSTDPSVTSIETLENGITNWNINAIVVTMSENINDATVFFSDFVIDSGSYNVTGFSTWAQANDNKFIIEFDEVVWTGHSPSVEYTGSTLADNAGRTLTPNTFASTDKATPRMLKAEAFDNNSNGKLDRIEVTFSENLTSTTNFTGLSLDNAYAGMSIASSLSTNEVVALTLNESSNFNTAIDSLTLTLSSSPFTDLAGNSSETFTAKTIDDKALPVLVSNETLDTNSNAKADTVRLTFSENITGASVWDFALNNLSSGSTLNSISTTTNTIDLSIIESSNTYDSAPTIEVVFFGSSIVDSASNEAASFIENSSEKIAPVIVSKETVDSDWNGHLDQIKLTFSENLNDDFSTLSASSGSFGTSGYSTDIANDEIIYIDLNESSDFDTDETPLTQISSNSSLWDSNGNIVQSESFWSNADDKAGPIIIWARYDEKTSGVADDEIYVTFSENVFSGSLDTSAGWASNDFQLNGGWALGWNSTTSILSATTAKITLWAWATPATAWVSTIQFKTAAADDNAGNSSPTASVNNEATLTASVIINEVMFSSNRDDQYIELRNLSSSTVDISGWIIENAGWNNVDITIPSGTISGDGYFLIARTNAASSILNVTPDLVDSNMNLHSSSQYDLVLTDWTSTLDSAKASPWPFGDSATPKAIERKETAWNGLTTSNWYTAETSTWFDTTTPKWTPGIANVFDGFAPVIGASFPQDNELYPIASTVEFDYTDDATGVDTTTESLIIRKWDGSSYGADIKSTAVLSQNVTSTNATYTLDNLDFGKYRAEFAISDTAWNTVNKTIVFYIDKFEFSIVNNDIEIGQLDHTADVISQEEVTITVKTVGAGFDIDMSKVWLLSNGGLNIKDYDGSKWFGFDIYKDEDGAITNYDNTLEALTTSQIASITKNIDTDGFRKTYTYKVKFWANVEAMQNPWVYSVTPRIQANISY